MTAQLCVSSSLSLPLSAVTSTFGLLAVRGAGKSNAMTVMAEEMFTAGLPFVVIDPYGTSWGLRASAAGSKRGGLPIPIFGGRHGDLPLEAAGGVFVADLIASKRLSCVLDLSSFEDDAKKRFLLAFARRLFDQNRDPLHLFCEEADDYIPQERDKDEKPIVRAFENLVRRGRSRGIGITLVTQRSAVLNKRVLTQVETLFVLRTSGPQDIAAIEAWVKYHKVGAEMLPTLAGLDDGWAWAWSPHFLKTGKRFQFRLRKTFDSGATPKNVRGRESRPTATLRDVNLATLEREMSASIERTKAEDPKELKRRIAELEKEVKAKAPAASIQKVGLPPGEVAVRRSSLDELVQILGGFDTDLGKAVQTIRREIDALTVTVNTRARAVRRTCFTGTDTPAKRLAKAPTPAASAVSTKELRKGIDMLVTDREERARESGGALSRGHRVVLTAIAQHPDGVSTEQLAVLTGYKRTSRITYVNQLISSGYCERTGDRIVATQAGIAALGDFEPLPTGRALLDYWLGRLPEGERRILQLIVDHGSVSNEAIEAETGYKRTSRITYVNHLSARKLVTKQDGLVALAEMLT